MFGLNTRRPDDIQSDGEEAPDRRKVVLLGAVGAVLVLALGYFLVLPVLFGSSSNAQANAVVPHVVRSASATPQPDSGTSVAQIPQPSTADVNAAGRDPFAPLPEEAAASAAAIPSTAATAGTTGATTDTTTTTGGSTTTGSSATTTDAAPAAAGTAGVMLVSISGDKATIEVDGQRSQVAKGAAFGDTKQYTLTAVGDSSVTIAHGGTRKTLAVGESQTF